MPRADEMISAADFRAGIREGMVPTRKIVPHEHLLQKDVFNKLKEYWLVYPKLRLFYAIPNGGMRPRGEAGRMKGEGARAGVPDTCLPIARCGHHSLYIEHKIGRNTLSPMQKLWRDVLLEEGHAYAVSRSVAETFGYLIAYLEGKYDQEKVRVE